MKKSLSRILSLALVLAMVVSVVPFALAGSADANGVSVSISAPTSIRPGQTLTVTANVSGVPDEATEKNYGYTWAGLASSLANTATYEVPADFSGDTISGSVTVNYSYKINVPLTPEDDEYDPNVPSTKEITVSGSVSDSYSVTVDNKYTPSLTGAPADGLKVGETCTLGVDYSPALPEGATASVTWTSSNTAAATVSETGGVVTAVGIGKTTITGAITVSGADVTLTKASVSCDIEVSTGAAISCDGISVKAGGTGTLNPSLVGAPQGTVVTWSFETKSNSISVSSTTGAVTAGTATGVVKVTVKATFTQDGQSVELTKDVSVSVYADHTAAVTVKSGVSSFDFDDENVFSYVSYDGRALNTSYSVGNTLAEGTWKSLILTERSTVTATKVGTLSQLSCTALTLANVKFTLNGTSGTQYIDYVMKDAEGLIVATGTLAITTGGSYGSIVYETDYNTPITFDEDDFESFWTNASTTTGTLKYVVFGVSTNVPAYGKLYTSSAKSKQVASTMMFQPNYATSSTYYDLDTVYYVPNTTYKTAYSVEIPFTAYGGATGTQTLTGTVVIELNGSSTDITSRGVVFGSGTTSLVDLMAADYKGVNNIDLVSVVFDLPDVEDGRLYYNYDGILDSARVSSKEEYFVEPSSAKELDLDKVAFIPAAGTTGKVTITYTGYGKDSAKPYQGKLTLNVVAKTKSDKFTDVTATSYSWAADSIDFLYYEEVVNGTSSTKFGPAASITRGDFMIMLYRAFLEEDYGSYNVTSNFADVPKGTSTYEKETYQAVGVAKYLGIAKGDGTNFNPKSSITREEAMTLIYRTLAEVDLELEYTSTKTTASFADYSKVSTYAQSSITYLIKHGIVIGSNGMINPKSNITRAEMAVILHRVLTY